MAKVVKATSKKTGAVEDEEEDEATAVQYEITSYGADYNVELLVKRLNQGTIFVPPFQRDYVWNITEASRLVESLLLGLPIPGVFFAKEDSTQKSLVIDGQQRLKSLQFFYSGYFNPKPDQKANKKFRLVGVHERFEGLTYHELSAHDRNLIDDAIIHATIIKQESPAEDNTAIYHIFKRLNSGGKKATPQEVRSAVYGGPLNDLIVDLNNNQQWREIFGKHSLRLKDAELILRFFAAYFYADHYTKPFNEFLNKFNVKYRAPGRKFIAEARSAFEESMNFIYSAIGDNAFKPDRALNAAVFESVMVGTAKNIAAKKMVTASTFKLRYEKLLKTDAYLQTVSSATADEKAFKDRSSLAIAAFSKS